MQQRHMLEDVYGLPFKCFNEFNTNDEPYFLEYDYFYKKFNLLSLLCWW